MRPGRRPLVATTVFVALLLAGCQSTPTDDLQDELAGIAGVESVDVDANQVTATLVDDITAADAETAILALRDQAVAGHSLGDQVELVVVIAAGTRDLGGAQPTEIFSYGDWSLGAVAGDGFGQQAAFLARLAEWETLLTTPARILHVRVELSGVDAPAETAAPEGGETPAPDDAAAAPTVQTRSIRLGQALSGGNAKADVDALIGELGGLWVASAGMPEAVIIR